MPGMYSYSKTEMERAMKVQKVLLRAMATLVASNRDPGSAIGTCGAGENVMKSTAMMVVQSPARPTQPDIWRKYLSRDRFSFIESPRHN